MPRAGQLITIALLIACLVALVVTKQRCADSVSTMFRVLDAPLDGGARLDGASAFR